MVEIVKSLTTSISALVLTLTVLVLVPVAVASAPSSEMPPPPPPSALATAAIRLSVEMVTLSPLIWAPAFTVRLVATVCVAVVLASLLLKIPPVPPPAELFTVPSAEDGVLKPAAPPTPSKAPEMESLVISTIKFWFCEGPKSCKSMPSVMNLCVPPAVLPPRFSVMTGPPGEADSLSASTTK